MSTITIYSVSGLALFASFDITLSGGSHKLVFLIYCYLQDKVWLCQAAAIHVSGLLLQDVVSFISFENLWA